MIRFIAAIDEKQGIANEQGIPWQGKIPGDVKYYRERIRNDIKLMGYGVYVELTHPYPVGTNYVATTQKDAQLKEGFEPVPDAVEFLKNTKDDVWDLGGAQLFASTIDLAEELYITQLEGDFKCTKFFPPYKDQFTLAHSEQPITENGVTYRFQIWKRTKAYV